VSQQERVILNYVFTNYASTSYTGATTFQTEIAFNGKVTDMKIFQNRILYKKGPRKDHPISAISSTWFMSTA